MFVPCGHNGCCKDCAATLKECPICRTKIEQVIRLYPQQRPKPVVEEKKDPDEVIEIIEEEKQPQNDELNDSLESRSVINYMKKSAYNIKKDDLVPDPVRPVVVGPNLMSPRISTVQQVN